jgi:hypothetical protein
VGWVVEKDILQHNGLHLLVGADRVDVDILSELLLLGIAHVIEDLYHIVRHE